MAASALPASAQGLVPCGYGSLPACTPCHLWVLAKNIIWYLLFVLALPILVVVILVAGIMLLTAGGNPGTVTKAKSMLTKGVLGIMLAFGAWLIVNTIINTLAEGRVTAAWNTISS